MNARTMRSIERNRFTIVELLVVVGVIAILAALLLPALKSARDTAKGISCINNEKQMGCAFLYYGSDNDNWLPQPWSSGSFNWYRALTVYLIPGSPAYPDASWVEMAMKPMLRGQTLFTCPTQSNNIIGTAYGIKYPGYEGDTYAGNQYCSNTKLAPWLEGGNASTMIMVGDCEKNYQLMGWATEGHPNYLNYCHRGGVNLLYIDGHASWRKGPVPNSSAERGLWVY